MSENKNIIKCKTCGADIAKNAKVCPSCGAKNKKPVMQRPGIWVLIVIVVIIVVAVAANGGGGSAPVDQTDGANVASEQAANEESGVSGEEAAELSSDEILKMLTNADDYKGKSVKSLPGVVFNVISQTEGDYEYQCWADSDSENQFVIISESDLDLSEGDNVFVDGIVRGDESGENLFGGEIHAAIIEATGIEKSETSVFNLAAKTIEVNETQEQHGISVTLERVELAEQSTRVILKVKNDTDDKISVYGFNSYIKQGSTQFDQSDISYEEDTIQTEINSGIESEGILSFQPIDDLDKAISVSIEISSDDYDISLKPFVFDVKG